MTRNKTSYSAFLGALLTLAFSVLANGAYAQSNVSRSALQSQNIGTFFQNSQGQITAPAVNAFNGNLIASMATQSDPNTFTATQTFNASPIMKTITGFVYCNGVSPCSSAAIPAAIQTLYITTANGMACDGATDDTNAFNLLLSTVNGAGGGTIYVQGTCLILGAVVFPNNGQPSPVQASIRITGSGSAVSPNIGLPLNPSPSVLDLRYNGTYGKLVTYGGGRVEIDHVTLTDGGTDCAPFFYTTNTVPTIHETVFHGTQPGWGACNDAIVLGGTSTSIGGGTNAPFQGYGAVIYDNMFDYIRREIYPRSYANNIVFVNNTGTVNSGSNLTSPITGATAGSTTTFTLPSHGFMVGNTQLTGIRVSGFTGSWAPLNGTSVCAVGCTVVDANTITAPVNTTGYGSLTGSPVYNIGAPIDLDGGGNSTGGGTIGNIITGNLLEVVYYAYPLQMTNTSGNTIIGNGFWDNGTGYICNGRIETTPSGWEPGVFALTYAGITPNFIPCGPGSATYLADPKTSLLLTGNFGTTTLSAGSMNLLGKASTGLSVQAGPTQSGNPFQILDSSGNVKTRVDTAYSVHVPSGATYASDGYAYFDAGVGSSVTLRSAGGAKTMTLDPNGQLFLNTPPPTTSGGTRPVCFNISNNGFYLGPVGGNCP